MGLKRRTEKIPFYNSGYWRIISPKQYKDRIRKWGLNKNIQQDEMEAMIRKRQERESESNKKTAFRIRGRPVDEEKIERYMRDHPKQLPINDHIDMDIDRNMSLAGMIASISSLIWINDLMLV
jgi:hypothetical protein